MTLFPVQIAALEAANYRPRFGYFLEMGLGKTLLALTEFKTLREAGKADTMMIFCPNSLISTWKSEIEKHGFNFTVAVKPELWRGQAQVVIYNYEAIIATAGKLIPIILAQTKTYGVFDESIQIKNFKSARVKKLSKWEYNLKYVRLLSGRPMVQSPMDLWSQLSLLNAPVNPSPYAFRNTYCRMGGWQNKVVIGVQNEEQLRAAKDKVSFTATKSEWTDLPEKMYTHRKYEMTALQNHIYKKMHTEMVIELKSKTISVQQAVHKFSKLQQVGSGFMIDEQGIATPIMDFNKVPKVLVLDEIIEESSGKLIVFAHYRASVEALSRKYACPTIRGGMSEAEIKATIDAFNNGDARLLVGQLAAAKYGLTLLGRPDFPCHTTVYFENNYSLDARLQSEDRNHRHGQHSNVLYIDLVGTPVDSRIIHALQKKNDLSRTILGMTEELRDAA